MKTFYTSYAQINDTFFLNKHYLSRTVYYKYLIRNADTYSLIDNSFSLHNAIKLSDYNDTKVLVAGHSLNLEDYFFNHADCKNISFVVPHEEFHQKQNNKVSNQLELLSSQLKVILNFKKRNKLKHAILVRPVKAGYCVYSAGLTGFLPMSSYRRFFFRTKQKNFFLNLLYRSQLEKYTFFWFQLVVGSIGIRIPFLRRKKLRVLRSEKKKKNKKPLNNFSPINVVFLTKKIIRRRTRRSLNKSRDTRRLSNNFYAKNKKILDALNHN